MTVREHVVSHLGRDETALPSGTVTFLFTDIEGSTSRWERHRVAMRAAVRRHDEIVRDRISAHGGHVFKTVGDAFCVAFATPEAAVSAALDAQRALGAADFSEVDGLRVRMALTTGTADERDGDYFGLTVNRVARLLALAHGGQTLLSGTAADLVRENLPPDAALVDLGLHALKDIERHERVFQVVAPGLVREFPPLRSATAAQDVWLVPAGLRSRYFYGRADIIERLRAQLVACGRAALSGLGGVGKTQAAAEYAARHRAAYHGGVFWVNAETDGGIAEGFVGIARALGLTIVASNDHERIVRTTLEWLSAHDGWLLIFDNVEDQATVAQVVPDEGRGHIVLTTRKSTLAELGIPRTLVVTDLSRDEAIGFLKKRTGIDEQHTSELAAAHALAAELGDLPLALEQAAAYIVETHTTFSAYLAAFRKRRIALLERASGLVSHASVAITWAANFEAVSRASPAAADVLRIAAFLAPDAIPFEAFERGRHALGASIAEALAFDDELAMPELLQPLDRYSLVRMDAASRAFAVHRLVQEIVRDSIASQERGAYVERAAAALGADLTDAEFEQWERCARLVPHAVALAHWVERSGAGVRDGYRLFNLIGRYLTNTGRFGEGRDLLERSLALVETSLGPDGSEAANTLQELGVNATRQGRLAEAQRLHERAMAMQEHHLGPDHLAMLKHVSNLGIVHLFQRDPDAAGPLYERALQISEQHFGPGHPTVATCLNNLAEARLLQGRFEEAEDLHTRALALRERVLGPAHPHVALSLQNLANIRARRGQTEEADVLLRRALAIHERSLGPEHPDVAENLESLAQMHLDAGRLDDALPLYQRSLDIFTRAGVGDHPSLGRVIAGLASVRRQQGDAAAALSLFERALAIMEASLGPLHPDLAQVRRELEAVRTRTAPA